MTQGAQANSSKEQNPHDGSLGWKVVAVLVFIPLILIGTYFAKGPGHNPLLGYTIGLAAFGLSGILWRMR